MLIILKPIFLQDNIFLIPLSIIFYVNGQKFQTFLSIDFCTQKNQLDDSWFLLYLQNYIHVDISLRINFLRFWSSPHPISNSQLHVLPHFHLCPIYLVVFMGSYFFRMGYLILRGASRLDAFSVYPGPTWLPGRKTDS